MTRVVAPPIFSQCGIEIQKNKSVLNLNETVKRIINSQLLQTICVLMKKKSCTVWVALLFAIAYGSVQALPIYDSPRHPRATDALDGSIENLKKVARVANGIYLTRKLIDGADKAETDAIIAELLKMGKVTPDQITNFKGTELEAAANAMKSLPGDLKSTAAVKIVEGNWKIMMKMNEDLEGIADYKTWPEQADFKTAVESLKDNGIDVSDIKKLKDELTTLGSLYGSIKDDPASYLGSTQGKASKVIQLIDTLKSDRFMFSAQGTATKLSAIPVKIVNTALLNQKINQDGITIADVDESKGIMNKIFEGGKNFDQLKPSFDILDELIVMRNVFGALRQLKHTAGLPDGYTDLNKVQNDVKDEWMKAIINSSAFDDAVSGLKQLDTPMSGFMLKMTHHADKLNSIKSVREEADVLFQFSAQSTEGVEAVKAISACSKSSSLTPTVPGIQIIETAAKKIDEAIKADKEKMDDVIAKIAELNAQKKLKDLEEICKKKDAPNADLAAIATELDSYNDSLIQPLNALVEKFPVESTIIKPNAKSAFDAVDKVANELGGLTAYHGLFGCVKVDNLDLVRNAFDMIESYRNRNGAGAQFDEITALTKAVTGTSADLSAAEQAMITLKGGDSDELKLLPDAASSKKTSEAIGKSVQAVIQMNEVFKKTTDIDTVSQNLDSITSEIPNGFDAADKTLLTALVALKGSFDSMKSSLAQWHTDVKDKDVTTLSDAKSIFEPSKDVTGVQGDLKSMIGALERLIKQVPGSSKIQDLQDLQKSLQNLAEFDLDFTGYSTELDEAGNETENLKTLFVSYSKISNGPEPQRTGGGDPKDPKRKDGPQRGQPVNEKDKDSSNVGAIVGGCAGGGAVLLGLIGLGVFYFWKKKNDAKLAKAQKDKENAEAAEAAKEEELQKVNDKNKELEALVKQFEEEMVKESKQQAKEDAERTKKVLKVVPVPPVVPGSSEKSRQLQKTQPMLLKVVQIALKKLEDYVNGLGKLIKAYQLPGNPAFFRKFVALAGVMLREASSEDASYAKAIPEEHKKFVRHRRQMVEKTRVHVTIDGKEMYYPANYITFGSPDNVHFPMIACQAPQNKFVDPEEGKKKKKSSNSKEDTNGIFWHMVHEQNANVILMLCKFEEEGSEKCSKYLPVEKDEVLKLEHDVTVTCTDKETTCKGEVIIRYLHIHFGKTGFTWTVKHYQYLVWPDHGAPATTDTVVYLMKEIRQNALPVVVHCSAGEGRTGCIAMIEATLANMVNESYRPLGTLYSIRQQRAGLVENHQQLAFSMLTALELGFEGHTQTDDQKSKRARITEMLVGAMKVSEQEAKAPPPAAPSPHFDNPMTVENEIAQERKLNLKTKAEMKKKKRPQEMMVTVEDP